MSRTTEWRKANPEKHMAWYRKYYRANCERIWAYANEQYQKESQLCACDAAYYAEYRGAQRKRCLTWRKKRRGQKKLYRPNFKMRIPDCNTKGPRALDTRSSFLDVNLTASQRAYARDLAIERKAAK